MLEGPMEGHDLRMLRWDGRGGVDRWCAPVLGEEANTLRQ